MALGFARICKSFWFSASHRLERVPEGHKCGRLHGHTYRVDIELFGEIDKRSGWVLDFDELSGAWASLAHALDHRHLNDVDGMGEPTSENLAWWIFSRLRRPLVGGPLPHLKSVTVHETPSTWARAEV